MWRENPLRSALGKRLLAWLLLLSLAPLILSNSIGYMVSGRIISRVVERDLEALTVVQAHHVRDGIERLLLALGSAAQADRLLVASAAALRDPAASPAALSGASRLAGDELAQLRAQLHVFSELVLVAPSGIVVASAPAFASGERWHEPDVVARAVAQHRAFALGRSGAATGPPLRFAAALPGAPGAPAAVVVGTVAPGDVGEALQLPRRLAGAIAVFITDEAGRPVFASDPREPVDYGRPLTPQLSGVAVPRDGRPVNAEGYVTSSEPVPGHALRFLSRVPVREALGELRWLRRLSLILAATFVLVLVGAAWIVSRGIVQPVSRLVEAVERIAQGDLDARVAVSQQQDEVGQLAARFNDMAGQLADSAARIRDLHDEQMRRAEQLATVGELAAGIAHELKTPLLGVASGAQLLSRRLDGSDVQGRRLVGEMQQRIRRMEEAMHQLLVYARPVPARFSRLDPNAIVERSLRLVEPRAGRSGVIVVRRFAATMPSVLMDPEQIGQVIVNLALNGIEAMDGGGILEVETRVVDGAAEMSVSDSGPGIPPEERDQVFRPFYTTKHTGTGLGLAMVRQIVERHGGQIQVADRPQGGARLVVKLPLADPPNRSPGESPA